MLGALAVANYRSLRNLVVPLRRLNVVTGPNGSGTSNLYRALRLLADTEQGRGNPSLAREVARAAERSQVSVVSHAAPLIETLGRQPGCHSITLDKTLGETRVAGSRELERPPWHCPGR